MLHFSVSIAQEDLTLVHMSATVMRFTSELCRISANTESEVCKVKE